MTQTNIYLLLIVFAVSTIVANIFFIIRFFVDMWWFKEALRKQTMTELAEKAAYEANLEVFKTLKERKNDN